MVRVRGVSSIFASGTIVGISKRAGAVSYGERSIKLKPAVLRSESSSLDSCRGVGASFALIIYNFAIVRPMKNTTVSWLLPP